MKKVLLLLVSFVFYFSVSAQIIISGVFDGPLTGGVPKVIELYVQSNIPDLSIYGLRSTNSAEGTAGGPEFTFPAIAAAAGQFISVATTLTDFNTYFGYNTIFVNGVASINGDDAIVLYQNGTPFDIFGNPSFDGSGQSWEYLDGWAYTANYGRTPSITFTDTDWLFSGVDATDGCTSNTTCASVFPTGATSADALPIELTYFTAKPTANNEVALEWRTESELNNDYMAIERSQDGQKFVEIGKVKGAGTTLEAQVYSFIDAAPKAGVNYYRLRQVDFDGAMEYHKIVAVTLGGDTKVTVYPTLVNNELNVSVAGTATVQITNLLGQIVKTAMVSDFTTLNVADLDNGTYFLILEMGTSRELVRFVKQ